MRDNYLKIAVLPGDGIGIEMMEAAMAVLDTLNKMGGEVELAFTHYPAGARHYIDTGIALPDSTLAACREADAILFGAMGWPDVRFPDGTEVIPQLDLRIELDLYAGVRPVRWFPGGLQVLKDERSKLIDFVLIREQTEGLFYARGRGESENDEVCYDRMKISRQATSRVSEFAFKLAALRNKNSQPMVTCVDKANVISSMAFFRKIFTETASQHRQVSYDYAYVDAMALKMLKRPWDLDVLVTENMFGDILSDLAAGLIGGMGMAPSGDIGDKHALFQPAHGTAPDIAGQGLANPCAMILSAAMMLRWLADKYDLPFLEKQGRMIDSAVEKTLADGRFIPVEYGGRAGTQEMTSAIISYLTQNGD
ncbi:isocitrate/isopropylmalate dehydrogenase family protein [Pantoea sp. App145]|uniref:isocitrate/isopropylmalate dehydrogenase family protein n=1 Tax=Pantoea sp. App145 TaxID=3071567 RepID=UPI003A80F1D6